VEGADQKLVLIAEVHIGGRAADIGAIENLLNDDEIVVSFVNQRVQPVAEQLLRFLRHAGLSFVELIFFSPLFLRNGSRQNAFVVR